ncbi:MAG: ExeM/NucH family extracellular endonuclease [Rubrivivax sp.]|nr:ExeM/NucH family extracellular endonuclease [Rubrivivax sp.]
MLNNHPPHRQAGPLCTALLALLLAACGGGGEVREEPADRAQPLRSTLPTNQDAVCPAPPQLLVDITAVQGPGTASPLEGSRVTVRGVVTADFRGVNGLGGFYIQQPIADNDPATSEGLFVFTGNLLVLRVGDLVQVTGTVTEFRRNAAARSLTQLAAEPEVERCGAAEPIRPATVALPLQSADGLSALQGMLVQFQQPLFVSGNEGLGRFGELVLSAQARLYHPNNHPTLQPAAARAFNALNRIVLDDARSTQNAVPTAFLSAPDSSGTRRAGDSVSGLQGIVTIDFDRWRMQPTVVPMFTPANPRLASAPAVGGTLKVASLNVLNYFTTLGERGADTSAEFVRQRDKLVSAIVALDADVLGLIEIENNNAVALQSLVAAVNARLGAKVYSWRTPGVIGTDLITGAVIYRIASVQPVGQPQVPDDADFIVNGGLRPPVAQRFAAWDNGGGFWLVVNHFKSKGGCPSGATGATSDDGDQGQGGFNAARTRQAQALTGWVATLVAASGESDVLMAGDFNAYLNEDPLAVLRNNGHENLLNRLPPEQRYSYVFDNEAGALDHAFANATLALQVRGVAIWHANADEPVVLDYNLENKPDDRYAPLPFRASDHDPVIVGLQLNADAPAAAAALFAELPANGVATEPVVIANLLAQPTPVAANVQLSVNWGDGSGVQLLDPALTRIGHVYAVAGRYTITLRLTQDGSLPALLSAPVVVAPAPVVAQPGLIISEYVEGSGSNKAVELYNPGDSAVDLGRYVLRLYSNGAAAATASLPLSGNLLPGQTLVLCHPNIDAAVLPRCQRTSGSVLNFNGDDALTLERDGVIVDQFGQVGFDPGTAWVDGDVSTLDRTLRRKPGVVQGSVPPGAPGVWGLAAEWDGLPINTFSGLGSR